LPFGQALLGLFRFPGVQRGLQALVQNGNDALPVRFYPGEKNGPLHARKVLAEFGRSFGRLPDNLDNLTPLSREPIPGCAVTSATKFTDLRCQFGTSSQGGYLHHRSQSRQERKDIINDVKVLTNRMSICMLERCTTTSHNANQEYPNGEDEKSCFQF
jgi:hypothetical protein